jgi:hypothetical protein
MTKSKKRIWPILFGIWLLLLTGLFSGSPGVFQALRLRSLLHSREAQAQTLELAVQRLEAQAEHLEKSRFAQLREIHQTLGYIAEDELLFDFSRPE